METYVSDLQSYLRDNSLDFNEIILDSNKPKYLQYFDLFDNDSYSKAILIRKERVDDDLDNSLLTRKTKSRRRTSDSVSEFDISGQPLNTSLNESLLELGGELSFSKKEKEVTHVPLPANEARKILAFACLNLKPTIPLWILTEPCDGSQQIMIGCSVENSVYRRHWVELKNGDKSVEDMLEIHRSFIPPRSRIDTEVMCEFSVTQLEGPGSTVSTVSSYTPGYSSGKITVKVFWKEPSFEIPLTGASVRMDLHGTVGLETSEVHFLWQQLNLLHEYFELLSTWNENQSYPLPEQQRLVALPNKVLNSMSETSISKKITNALNFTDNWYSGEENERKLSQILMALKNEETHHSDLTSRLWLVLTECTTHFELTSNMAYLLQAVKKTTANTYMGADNHTRLGRAIKAILNDPHATNPLFLLEPLQLLVEIGLLKLKKDYIAAFTDALLAKEEALELPSLPSFTGIDGPSWFEVVSSYLTWMSKVHAAIELVCVAHANLLVKKPTIVSLTSQILKNYVGPNSPVASFSWLTQNPKLNCSATMDRHLYSMPQDLKYDKWLMKLHTNNDFHSVITKFLRTGESPFPSTVHSFDEFSIASLDNTNYILAQMTTISSNSRAGN